MVLRPRFLAGVIYASGQGLTIRSRWRLFHRHAWATLQFRYLEFRGPCRLIVAVPGGLRVEHITPGEAGPKVVRRISPVAAIAFTPNLECALVRTERFWRYVQGRVKLIEMSFAGPGVFLAKTAVTPAGNRFSRFFSAGGDRLLRVFGA